MARDHAIERARRAGARRRALDEGRPLPPEPAAPSVTSAVDTAAPGGSVPSAVDAAAPGGIAPSAVDATAPGGSAPAGTASEPAPATTPAPTVAGGPWSDARAFFLGWLAMIAALVAGLPALVIAGAGFAAAYLLARRGRLANAIASVGGAIVAAVLAVVALVIVGLIASV